MDYVFIIISMLGFTLQFILMQIYEKQIKQTLTTGILLIVIENLVGAAFFFAINGGCIAVSGEALLLAALLAIVLIAYNLLSLRALALGNLAIYSMFMMLGGMALPFAYGVVFLKETISVCKFIGLFALTGFIVLQAVSAKPDKGAEMQSGEVKGKKAQRTGYVLCCLAVFIINGLTGVISKAHQVGKNAVDEKSFIVLYCLITMLLGLCIFGADTAIEQKKGRKLEWRQTLKAKPLGISALLGIVMYGANYFLLLAARSVPASAQFPIVSGGVIVLSALASVLIFKDKLSKTETVAVVGSFLSTVLFAF